LGRPCQLKEKVPKEKKNKICLKNTRIEERILTWPV